MDSPVGTVSQICHLHFSGPQEGDVWQRRFVPGKPGGAL